MMSLCAATSSRLLGRYFSLQGTSDAIVTPPAPFAFATGTISASGMVAACAVCPGSFAAKVIKIKAIAGFPRSAPRANREKALCKLQRMLINRLGRRAAEQNNELVACLLCAFHEIDGWEKDRALNFVISRGMMGNASITLAYDSPASVARKLSNKDQTVLAFLSPACGLCKSLEPHLEQVNHLKYLDVALSSDSGHCMISQGGLSHSRRPPTAGGTRRADCRQNQLPRLPHMGS